jgi:hypothetical protein
MLDKAILHKKEYRKQYHGARAVDKTCRNHGSDEWALRNRLNNSLRRLERTEFDLRLAKFDVGL